MKKTFIGQQKIKDLFLKLIASKTVGHCYTLIGEKGMGKSTLSGYIAKMLVCEHGTACGSCKACIMADAGTHPDIEYVLPEEGKKNIGVGVVRNTIENIYVRPYNAEKKVIVINNFETALTHAQNALLKVLEEPPEYVVFILTSSSEQAMLDTIKSRSLILRLQPYSKEEIKRFLRENTNLPENRLDFISAYSNGNTGKGKQLAESEGFSELRENVFGALVSLTSGGSVIPFSNLAGKDNSKNIGDILECSLSFFRDMLMYKIEQPELAVNVDYAAPISKAAEKTKTQRILKVMQDIMDANANLQRNINYNLAVMSVVLCSLEEING